MKGAQFRCLNQLTTTMRHPEDTPRITDENGAPITQFMGLAGFTEQALSHEHNLVKIIKKFHLTALACSAVASSPAWVRPSIPLVFVQVTS